MKLLRIFAAAMLALLTAQVYAAQTACPPEQSRARAFGLSTDTKPTFATNCAQFYETDTRKEYQWNGSSWVHAPQDVSLGTLIEGEDQTLHRLWGGQKGLCTSLTADGVIKASAGVLISVNITNASANDDVLIYDNASAASGTVVFDALNVAAGTTIFPNVPAAASNGFYMDLTTAGSMHVLACYQ